MNKARTIIRIVFLIIAVSLLVSLNSTQQQDVKTIAQFKMKMIEKMRSDSLRSKDKLDLIIDDTKKFLDKSNHLKEDLDYLLMLFALWAIVELVFLQLARREMK